MYNIYLHNLLLFDINYLKSKHMSKVPNRLRKVKLKKSSRKNAMRKVMENQLKLGQVDICNILIDLQCRDEIPQVLLGLQAIYSNREVRGKVFSILNEIIPIWEVTNNVTLFSEKMAK